jgi:ribosomal protein S14
MSIVGILLQHFSKLRGFMKTYGMGTWRTKHKHPKTKTQSKLRNSSQSTGRSKGIIPTPLQKWMCRKNRSWKDPLYFAIMGHGEFKRKGAKHA